MKIRTDFVTNSSSTGYVVVTITTTQGTEWAKENYDTGYGGWIWNHRSIDSVLEDLNKVKNGEELYKVLMDSVESFEYFSQDVNGLLENIKSRDELIEIELEEETHSDEVADHNIYKFHLKYDFKNSRVIELEDGYHDEREDLTSITIPEGTTTIEEGEFSGLENLKSIVIPNSVTSIGVEAFSANGVSIIPLDLYIEDLRSFLNIDFAVDWNIGRDMNVAHEEIDIKNAKTNRNNAGFTDREREKMTQLLDSGLIDTFRYFHPDLAGVYLWWSYRFNARVNNAGWRIDYFLVSDALKDRLKDVAILTDVMGSIPARGFAFQDGNGRVGRLIAFKECLRHSIIPFIIEDPKKAFYYRGLSEWGREKGYLTDTCLDGQDTFRKILQMFDIDC